MSCPNFLHMKYDMPLICGKTFEQAAADYLRDYGEEMTEDIFLMEEQFMIEDAEQLAKQFTESLKFHTVSVEAGYYTSYQFYVEEKYHDLFDLEKSAAYCLDNEDARYYFDMCRSEVIRRAASEKRRIRKWLNNLRNNGFNLVHCTGIFSNGEAVYSIA